MYACPRFLQGHVTACGMYLYIHIFIYIYIYIIYIYYIHVCVLYKEHDYRMFELPGPCKFVGAQGRTFCIISRCILLLSNDKVLVLGSLHYPRPKLMKSPTSHHAIAQIPLVASYRVPSHPTTPHQIMSKSASHHAYIPISPPHLENEIAPHG